MSLSISSSIFLLNIIYNSFLFLLFIVTAILPKIVVTKDTSSSISLTSTSSIEFNTINNNINNNIIVPKNASITPSINIINSISSSSSSSSEKPFKQVYNQPFTKTIPATTLPLMIMNLSSIDNTVISSVLSSLSTPSNITNSSKIFSNSNSSFLRNNNNINNNLINLELENFPLWNGNINSSLFCMLLK